MHIRSDLLKGCVLPRDELQKSLDKLLNINKPGSPKDSLYETALVKSVREHVLTDGV